MITHSDKHERLEDSEKSGLPELKTNRDVYLHLYIQIKNNRKWWLLPLLFVLMFLGLFVSLTAGNTSILPAIYALF